MRRAVSFLLILAGCAPSRTPAPFFEAPLGARVAKDLWFVELDERPEAMGGRRAHVSEQHRRLLAALERDEVEHEVRQEYSRLFNGFSIHAAADELERLRKAPGVKAVYPVLTVEAGEPPEPEPSNPFGGLTQPELFTALAQTGADVAQNTLGLTGAGIRVAIVDTGTDFTNPDLGGCFGPTCRVSFGWDFVGDAFDGANPLTQPQPDPTPDDCRGHGTHVSGIIMANGRVKGVAPGVQFGSYRVFGCGGSTTNDLLIAGIERAVADGARVINISLGNPFSWPQYPTAMAATAARSLGVIVTSSQGNNGTGGLYGTSAPGAGDDVLSAGSVENTASAQAAFTLSPDNARVGYEPSDTAPPAPLTGTFPIAAMPPANALGCNALTAGSLTGQVALIPRGTCSYTIKAQNAQAAGAVAVVVSNNTTGLLQMQVTGVTVPTVMVSQADGATITTRLGMGPVSLTWGSSLITPRSGGGQMSSASSWGPTAELGLKPDVVTPGGGIFSTWRTNAGSWATISGTSMAAAHLAGLSALLLQAQPTLTPAELGDVLRNTATPVTAPSSMNLEATIRQGAGLVRITEAAQNVVRVAPSKLSLGESQGVSSFTRTLTLTNRGAAPLVFTPSHAPALSVIGDAYSPTSTAAGQATVTFSSPTVTAPAGGPATVSVTITPNAMLPARSFYGGFLVFTSGATVLRVPYAGFSGDYQTTTVINWPDAGPYLSRGPGPSFTPLPDGGVFTLAGSDTPTVVVHLDHFSRTFDLEAVDAVTGKPWGSFFSMAYVGKDYTATAWQRVQWDGFTTFDKSRRLLPNGAYRIKMTVLKPLGDAGTPADVETWLSPPVTLNHP
ncbi:MAG: S8 family serine peptidase [Myxococcaceae bacterium]|nr:S8 family serine peptidase [Myxococcaceae bacterium]